MAYLWDTNILRHFWQEHPILHKHLQRTGWKDIALPSVVVAEVLRGRCDFALKATPDQAPLAHQRLIETQQLLQQFNLIIFDQACAREMTRLQRTHKSRKRYADMMIAAMALAGRHTLITRNLAHFADLLPASRLANWIDAPPS